MNTRLFTFAGGETGVWRVVRMDAVAGAPLPGIPRLDVAAGSVSPQPLGTKWPSIRFNCDLRAAYTCDTRSPAKPGKSSVSNNLGVTRHVCLASHQSLGKFSTYGLLFLSSISQGISCRLELAPCPAFEEGSPYTSGLHLVRYGRFPVVGQ